ncbi:MAG: hypothetical protein K6T66_00835 [Peptococcaceae bacterium]|nr:hypothetical protein [Peptococcaceae bacterium]
MSEPAGGGLNMSIERLIGKMEKIYERQAVESTRMENMLSLLDRFSVILARMEDSRNFELDFARKIDLLNKSLEQAANIQEKMVRGQEGPDTVERVINGIKIFGLILSTVANSIQVTMDNIGAVLKKNSDAGPNEAEKSRARTQADLASILQPVSTLVKNLVEEKMKEQELPARKDKGDSGEIRDGKDIIVFTSSEGGKEPLTKEYISEDREPLE